MSLDTLPSSFKEVIDHFPNGHFNSLGQWVPPPVAEALQARTALLVALVDHSVCPSCHRLQTFKVASTEVLFCTDPYHVLRAALGVAP